jgi:hypothetical protein
MATTTNYGWTTPDDTSLVKDGAAAIRTLGSSVDTTTKALNPSTTLGDIEYRSSTANTNTRLAVGTTGQVLTVAGGVPSWATPAATTPTFAGCYLTNASDFSLPNNTNTAVTWSSETFDTDGYHSTSTNTSRITIPAGKAGKYLLTFAGFYENGGTSNSPRIRFYKNGTVFLSVQESAQFQMMFVLSSIVSLAESDYVEVYLFHNSGGSAGTLYGTENSNFTATFLGA